VTKRRKQLYGGFLLLGALALLADRGLFSQSHGPAGALADGSQSLGGTIAIGHDGPSVLVAATPFPSVYDSDEPPADVRDMFRITDTIRAAMDMNENDETDGPQGPRSRVRPPVALAPFSERHSLQAVMVSRGVRIAVIDGRWVRIGDQLDDCQLADIIGTQAEFDCGDRRETLSINAHSVTKNSDPN
jgi:hypothetical protein